MVALRYLLGMEITADVFKCRNCENLYHVKNGVTALRRHYETKHVDALNGLIMLFGLDKKNEMTLEKSIKLEEPEQVSPQEEIVDFQSFQDQEGPSAIRDSESALQTTSGKQPSWVPSSKGRSIVWEHIQWVAESQRASCNYCQAEFQIKGGTSALLRHLKTNHAAAINFDPDNPPPVVRRRKRKGIEDYTIVTEDTKSYMDNLLETFMHEDMVPRIDEDAPTSPQPPREPQNRANSEIDEVIRTLQNETAQNGFADVDEPDRNLRQMLGIADERPLAESSGEKGAEPRLDEEKQVSSSSGPSPEKQQKRKPDETLPTMRQMEAFGGKFPTLSAIHRRPPPSSGPPFYHHQASPLPTVPPPTHLLNPHHLNPIPQMAMMPPMMPGMPAKYNAQTMQILDFEAKVLYNQSMHSTIAREDAMTTYYRMKSRKMELEIKKLERELGEEHDEQG